MFQHCPIWLPIPQHIYPHHFFWCPFSSPLSTMSGPKARTWVAWQLHVWSQAPSREFPTSQHQWRSPARGDLNFRWGHPIPGHLWVILSSFSMSIAYSHLQMDGKVNHHEISRIYFSIYLGMTIYIYIYLSYWCLVGNGWEWGMELLFIVIVDHSLIPY